MVDYAQKTRKKKHTDEISVLKVETVELVTGLLCIHHILIYNKSRAFRVVGDPLADLTVQSISNPYVILERQGMGARECYPLKRFNVPYRSKFSKEIKELVWCDVVAASRQ